MKVLIVEDSDLLQTRLRKMITDIDQSIHVANAFNCYEANEMFYSFEPDLIVMDVSLPDGSGINLLKRFKEIKPSVKSVVFTNYPRYEIVRDSKESGADLFLDKSNAAGLMHYIYNHRNDF